MKRWLIVIAMALFCAITTFIITLLLYKPEPDFCALCHPAPYHAPCLVNITTGDITELDIYEAHAVKVGEVSPTQSGGYMRLSMAGGVVCGNGGHGVAYASGVEPFFGASMPLARKAYV